MARPRRPARPALHASLIFASFYGNSYSTSNCGSFVMSSLRGRSTFPNAPATKREAWSSPPRTNKAPMALVLPPMTRSPAPRRLRAVRVGGGEPGGDDGVGDLAADAELADGAGAEGVGGGAGAAEWARRSRGRRR